MDVIGGENRFARLHDMGDVRTVIFHMHHPVFMRVAALSDGHRKSQPLNRKAEIQAACDSLLEQVDAIVTPTIPAQPKPIGKEFVSFAGEEEPIFDCMIRYASYFNLTGHPAISLPVGLANGKKERSSASRKSMKIIIWENFMKNAASKWQPTHKFNWKERAHRPFFF